LIEFRFIENENIHSIIPSLQVLKTRLDEMIKQNNTKAHKFWEKEGYEVIGLHYQKKFENI